MNKFEKYLVVAFVIAIGVIYLITNKEKIKDKFKKITSRKTK